jgi:hypothetical protein
LKRGIRFGSIPGDSSPDHSIEEDAMKKQRVTLDKKPTNGIKVLFAVKIGEEDWEEQLITEVEGLIPEASEWAKNNGFDRLRVAVIDDSFPDFAGTVRV